MARRDELRNQRATAASIQSIARGSHVTHRAQSWRLVAAMRVIDAAYAAD